VGWGADVTDKNKHPIDQSSVYGSMDPIRKLDENIIKTMNLPEKLSKPPAFRNRSKLHCCNAGASQRLSCYASCQTDPTTQTSTTSLKYMMQTIQSGNGCLLVSPVICFGPTRNQRRVFHPMGTPHLPQCTIPLKNLATTTQKQGHLPRVVPTAGFAKAAQSEGRRVGEEPPFPLREGEVRRVGDVFFFLPSG